MAWSLGDAGWFARTTRVLGFVGIALVALACNEEDPPAPADAGTEACAEIAHACHDVDTGTGRISECHDLGHDEDEGACLPVLQECVALCEEAARNDGGPHDHDAGAYDGGDSHSH